MNHTTYAHTETEPTKRIEYSKFHVAGKKQTQNDEMFWTTYEMA